MSTLESDALAQPESPGLPLFRSPKSINLQPLIVAAVVISIICLMIFTGATVLRSFSSASAILAGLPDETAAEAYRTKTDDFVVPDPLEVEPSQDHPTPTEAAPVERAPADERPEPTKPAASPVGNERIEWQQFTSVEGGYSVLLPGPPLLYVDNRESVPCLVLQSSPPADPRFIIVVACSELPKNADREEFLKRLVETRQAGLQTEAPVTVAHNRPITGKPGIVGREVFFRSENPRACSQYINWLFLYEYRAYSFLAIFNSESEEPLARKSFDSFRPRSGDLPEFGAAFASDTSGSGNLVSELGAAARDGTRDLSRLRSDGVPWTVTPDAAPTTTRRLARKPLKMGPGRFRNARFAAADAGQVALLVSDQRSRRFFVQRHNLGNGRVISRMEVDEDTELLDFRPDGQVILLKQKDPITETTSLELWHCREDSDERLAELSLYEDPGHQDIAWAAFAGRDRLLTRLDDGDIDVWQLPEGKAIDTIPLHRSSFPGLSHGRRYLVAFWDDQIDLYDTSTCERAGRLKRPPMDVLYMASATFSPDGTVVAATLIPAHAHGSRALAFWNLTDGELIRTLPIKLWSGGHQWLGSRYLLVGKTLIDLELEASVWSYYGSVLRGLPDGRLWLADTDQFENIRLMALDAPSEKVRAVLDRITAGTRPLLEPGATVNLQLLVQTQPPRRTDLRPLLEQKFTQALQANRCAVSTGNPLTLRVTVKERSRGGPLKFRRMFGDSSFSVPNRDLVLEYAFVDSRGNALWHTSISAGIGFTSLQREGSDPARHVLDKRWETLLGQLQQIYLPSTIYPWSDAGVIGSSHFREDGESIHLHVARGRRF